VLAGGADEDEERLYNMKERLNDYTIRLTCGASFFILSNEKGNAGSIKLIDVGSFGLIDDHKEIIIDFLKPNNLTAAGIDLVLYASTGGKTTEELDKIFGSEKLFDYQKISGVYFTNPAFAMHFAVELLLQKTHPVFGKGNKTILVYNNIISENLGLILLTSNTD